MIPRSQACCMESFRLLNSGLVTQLAAAFQPGGAWKKIKIPAIFAAMRHPVHGWLLFDTGYSPRFYPGTQSLPFRLFRLGTPLEVTEGGSAVGRVRRLGVEPGEVTHIFLSHFDPDHYGGLKDFPDAKIVCHREAWDAIRLLEPRASFHHRLIPGHVDGVDDRIVTVEPDQPGVIPGFDQSLDYFGDGSIILIPMPGHQFGHLAALVRIPGGEKLLAGDAAWSLVNVDRDLGGLHGLLAVDHRAQRETRGKLAALRLAQPELEIIFSHCPETADQVLEANWRNDP